MKLKIDSEKLVEATVNLETFEYEMKRTFDLEKSVNKAITIKYRTKDVPDILIKTLIFFGLDWGVILSKMPETTVREMNVRIHAIKEENMIRYEPGATDGLNYIFREIPVRNRDAVIILQDFIPNPEFNVGTHLAKTIFNYSEDKRWQILFTGQFKE